MAPPAEKRRAAADAATAWALGWLESFPKVSKWMSRYDLPQIIEQGSGIAIVEDFLPAFVAEGALRILEGLPPDLWNDTAADEDYTHNNIAHRFWSIKAGTSAVDGDCNGKGVNKSLETLLRAFSLLLPDQFNAFSAGRYVQGSHIAPHDDRAYTPVMLDTGEVITCSRDVTCVYYLTKDWQESMGGAFVDLEASPPPAADRRLAAQARLNGSNSSDSGPQQQQQGRVYVPRFNSAVFFRVPHYHMVTTVTTDRPRWSIFGWYLQPGRLYELYTGEGEEGQAAARGDEEQQHRNSGQDRQTQVGKHKQARHQQQQPELDPDEGVPRCKLARRLLAKVAAKQQRQQEQLALV